MYFNGDDDDDAEAQGRERIRKAGFPVEDENSQFWFRDNWLIRSMVMTGVLSGQFNPFDLIAVERVNRQWREVMADTSRSGLWFQIFMGMADTNGLFRDANSGRIAKPALDVYTNFLGHDERNWRHMTIALMTALIERWHVPLYAGDDGIPYDVDRADVQQYSRAFSQVQLPVAMYILSPTGGAAGMSLHIRDYDVDDRHVLVQMRPTITHRADPGLLDQLRGIFNAYDDVEIDQPPLGFINVVSRGQPVIYPTELRTRGPGYSGLLFGIRIAYRLMQNGFYLNVAPPNIRPSRYLRDCIVAPVDGLVKPAAKRQRQQAVAFKNAGLGDVQGFSRLPQDIQIMLISNLDRRSIQNLCQVSTYFAQLCYGVGDRPSLWNRLIVYRYGAVINRERPETPLQNLRAHAAMAALSRAGATASVTVTFPQGTTPLPLDKLVFTPIGGFVLLDRNKTTGGSDPESQEVSWTAEFLEYPLFYSKDTPRRQNSLVNRRGVNARFGSGDDIDVRFRNIFVEFDTNSDNEETRQSARQALVDLFIRLFKLGGYLINEPGAPKDVELVAAVLATGVMMPSH